MQQIIMWSTPAILYKNIASIEWTQEDIDVNAGIVEYFSFFYVIRSRVVTSANHIRKKVEFNFTTLEYWW